MSRYILRLDDACEKMDIKKWDKIEVLCNKYNVKPLVGIIPHCEDPMMDKYDIDKLFWDRVDRWVKKGWIIALHGYNHVYSTQCGGINPIHRRSEFAGESLEVQKEKIKLGVAILKEHNINPKVFFAPSHTFDTNTLLALKLESEIRIISDTVAWNTYNMQGITFVPQQSGHARRLPFKTITFCYHPNTMSDESFKELDLFMSKNRFISFPLEISKKKKGLISEILHFIYLKMHR